MARGRRGVSAVALTAALVAFLIVGTDAVALVSVAAATLLAGAAIAIVAARPRSRPIGAYDEPVAAQVLGGVAPPGGPMPEPPGLAARQPGAVRSALAVLEAVAHLGAGVSAQRISTELGLARATTYRLLNLLVEDEYLVRTPDLAGFALGARVAQLAGVTAPPARLPGAARALLAEARRTVRGGVHVVLFVEGRVVVLDADPDFPLSDADRLVREPGRYALGRMLLVAEGQVPDAAVAADLRRFGVTRQCGESCRRPDASPSRSVTIEASPSERWGSRAPVTGSTSRPRSSAPWNRPSAPSPRSWCDRPHVGRIVTTPVPPAGATTRETQQHIFVRASRCRSL